MARRAKPKPKPAWKRGRLERLFRTLVVLVLIFGLIGPVAIVTLYRFTPPPMPDGSSWVNRPAVGS